MKRIFTLSFFCLTGGLLFAHTGAPHNKLVPATQSLNHESVFETSIVNEKRVFKSNGIPCHSVAPFPNRGNPHEITEQNYRLSVPAKPEIAEEPTPLIRQPFGIALNGVLFDPGTAEYYKNDRSSKWNYEALSSGTRPLGLDENHAHVQPNGAYHYHGIPSALVKELSKDSDNMTLVGWAADGFPIYAVYGYKDPNDSKSGLTKLTSSYRIKEGNRPTGDDSPGGKYDGSFTLDYEYDGSGDLDECGGRMGVTPEFPEGTYYYVLTDDYPFIPRMFKGTPDPSFNKRGGRNGRGRGGPGTNGRRGPPQQGGHPAHI